MKQTKKKKTPNEHQKTPKPTSKEKTQNQAKRKTRKKSQHWLVQNPPANQNHAPEKQEKKPHSWIITSSPTKNFFGNVMKLLPWKTFFVCLKKTAPQKMKFCWQNKGMRPHGLPTYQASWCYHALSLVCSSTASLLRSKGVLRTLKIRLISTSERVSCSYFFMILSALLKYAILFFFISAFENRNYISKFISENNFIAFFLLTLWEISHISQQACQVCLALNWVSEFWFWACFSDTD